jgi:hypothetical protein
MIEIKQNQVTWVPVRLFDASTSEPLAGVASSSVTVTVIKSDTLETSYNPASGAFLEHTAAAAAGAGLYQLHVLTTDVDTTGSMLYVVKSSGSKPFVGSIKVVANEEYDTYSRIGAPTFASVSNDIALLSSSLRTDIFTTKDYVQVVSSSLYNMINSTNINLTNLITSTSASLGRELTRARQFTEGRWKIEATGGDAYKMIFYMLDGVTPLVKFNLKDAVGNPTVNNPFERVPE